MNSGRKEKMPVSSRLNLRFQKSQEISRSPSEVQRPSTATHLHHASRKRRRSGSYYDWTEQASSSPLVAPLHGDSVPVVPDAAPPMSPIAARDGESPPRVLGDQMVPSDEGDQLVPSDEWQTSAEEEDLGLYSASSKKR